MPVALLGLLGARRNRFLAEFALLSGPIVAGAVTDGAGRLAAWVTGARRDLSRMLATVAAVAALAGAAVVPRLDAARRGDRMFDLGIEPALVPTAAIAFATDNGLRDYMYNDMEVGSYLTWEGWPGHRVFQDPRINGYPPAFHAQLRRDDMSPAEWDALLAGFGVTTALLTYPDENPRAAYFDPERWALVYRAADGLVFVRAPAGVRRADGARRDPGDILVQPHGGRASARRSIAVPADRRWPIANGSGGWATSSSRPATTRARSLPIKAPLKRPAASTPPHCRRPGWRWATPRSASTTPLPPPPPTPESTCPARTPTAPSPCWPCDRPREAADEARRALALAPHDADAQLADRLARERLAR